MKVKRDKSVNSSSGRPATNQLKKNMLVILLIAVTAMLVIWVYSIGQKAEQTIKVVVMANSVYKNQAITEAALMPYDMLLGEYEKLSITNNNGVTQRRVMLWEERGMIIGAFAAYPLKQGAYAEYRDFVKSRVDNSDQVLYSFPGKEVVSFDIGTADLSAFKTFLQPGDRLNIEAIYKSTEEVVSDDGFGGEVRERVEVFKTETVFQDIMIADLLNGRGESILDIYAGYNDLSVYEQAKMDASQDFKDRTSPRSLLVALTPQEKDRYYFFMAKSQVTFRASMPQRVD